MSHVVSSQPSATSPYQPTAIQDTGSSENPTRIHGRGSDGGQDDCCINTRNKNGFCLAVCTLLSMCCQGIKNCTESCCDCCANCLNDCCEDKPRDRDRRYPNQRYRKSVTNNYFDDADNNDDWGINSLSAEHTNVGVGGTLLIDHDSDTVTNNDTGHNSSTYHINTHDRGTHHTSGNHSSTHDTSGHDSGTHHTSGHDSGTHHTSGHDSGTHHTSGHDAGTCDSGFNSGGGFDSGGGDTGGGCDSGGGGGCDD